MMRGLVVLGIAAALASPLAAGGHYPPHPTPTVTETPTPTPTIPVVPIPALFAAEPTPPTCENAGSFDFSGTFPNVDVSITPAYTGPGTYTLTVTATGGATFPDGTTSKSRVITVAGALGFQSTDANAPCYLAPTPTPTPTPTVTPTPQQQTPPAPTPTRTTVVAVASSSPTHAELAATGAEPELWLLASGILLAGVATTVHVQRRRRTT